MDDAELIRAIEDNAAELLLAMGAAGGGRQRSDHEVRWTIGGSPIDYHNAVVSCAADDADQVIAESLQELKNHGVPGSWHVGPSMRPLDLGDRLLAAGFSHAGSEPGMALRLTELREAEAAGLRVERIGLAELGVWEHTLGRGFGEGPKEARWVSEVYRRLGVTDPWRHYLGYLGDQPVATATVFLAAGVAGLYFVMTVPEARRRGIGAAITAAVLREARDSGSQYAVLGASPAGRSVYGGLGFREYCAIDLYERALPQE
ncbi:GNAT family N-acetyltransferase [Kribbella catacumbae]|uniref:GNAT family N-acetyltransferase n=1 Tax=Kribbella catacumbae TaxID=460086 RepID=UPI000373FB10|nr:GNAT family N-acetyltransferase [Kribbella catacumbae]